MGATLDGTITSWNPGAERLFGYSEAEALGMPVLRLTPPGKESDVRGILARLAEGDHLDPYVASRLTKSGAVIEVSMLASAVRDADGVLIGMVAFAHELSAQRAAERAAERAVSESDIRSFVEYAPIGIVIADATMKVTYVNPAFTELFGYTLEDLDPIGAWLARAYPDPEARAAAAADWSAAAAVVSRTSGPPGLPLRRPREHRITCADGTVKSAMASGRSIRGALFGAFTDVTDRQQARAERDRLAAVVEQSTDSVLVVDAAGFVSYANPTFLRRHGRPLEDVVGRPSAALIAGLLDADATAAMEQAVRQGSPWLAAADRTLPDGKSLHLEVSGTPTRDASGTVTGYMVIGRDVTELRETQHDLALEATVRAVLATAMLEAHPNDSLADSVKSICDRLATLPGIDYTAVEAFDGENGVVILASHEPEGFSLRRGTAIPPSHSAYVRERVKRGPWAEYWRALPEDGVFNTLMADIGLKAMAIGPIVHGDHVDGLLAIGTRQDAFAQALVEKMPALVSFSTASSALLAERLHERRRVVELRASLGALLGAAAFHPVFQPIVDLESREVVGYEALTRFDSGQQPDLCFADAWSVGLGPDLEIATLATAVTASRLLPPGRWLNLNISPRLLTDSEQLDALLCAAERPIVLEITEHVVIDDYGAVREAIHAPGRNVRLAVDDAGVGVANFNHIIELRPDFVKLDIGVVRHVNADTGRQAMVVAMRHFARTSGCRLVAEGVETEEEAATLRSLGVEFGQGYLYGRPEPPEAWATTPALPS